MTSIGHSERVTQNRVLKLFQDELGYRYLGNWTDRAGNSNIEEPLLTAWLEGRGHTPAEISAALFQLRKEADHQSRRLYASNEAVYKLLRYGVPVKVEADKVTETVRLVDWRDPARNDFAIAEEVTLRGGHERRPDLVLYLNGIAICVLELKNSRASLANGIRQLLSNQQPEFNERFFSTVQLLLAGNDSEGLRYGTVGTEEKVFLRWKEAEEDNRRFKLDKYLLKLCAKERLLELIHDFVVFDLGKKKLPRAHQYFGIKAAQEHVRQRKGGILWHTQGSGKSIVMVLLAQWILENNPHARVAVITDRDELDKQIHGVFSAAGVSIHRTHSGEDLMRQLRSSKLRLFCSLIHKFGRRGKGDFDAFLKELEAQPSLTVGELFVFVDECHRTQDIEGKLHRVMKAMMPNSVFFGFTGTPLLVKDRATSFEVFGGYIHTYKFSEGVADQVILDLVYEARDIDQRLGSEDRIDAWFEVKTRGLNSWQKAELKSQWGTMQAVLSSRSRMDRVVTDIVFDFSVKPRLENQRGNAILVASSIYEACKYFTLFQRTQFRGRCAIVTSYDPLSRDVTQEETGANTETDKQFLYSTYMELLKEVEPRPGMNKTEAYEEWAKGLFVKQPANMKLLIVVDKLLTGFDAPSCTYLYIDKSMQDHGLFQAICRVNRLDGDDKDFGYIVDYKDLFKKLVNDKGTGALQVYTSALDHSASGATPEVLLQDRLKKAKENLDNALETLALLCEPVEVPKGELDYLHYFCGNTEIAADLEETEPRRAALYKGTVVLIRAFANLAGELELAGYGGAEILGIKDRLNHYLWLRDTVRRASNEILDFKTYEADMRHLIDTYIEADLPRKISRFEDMGLLGIVVHSGLGTAIDEALAGLKGDRGAIAETIENNVRQTIIQAQLTDPAYFAKMSALLDEIIRLRKLKAIEYEEFLRRIEQVILRVKAGHEDQTPEPLKRSSALRALYNNLKAREGEWAQAGRAADDGGGYSGTGDPVLDLAQNLHSAILRSRPDDWRSTEARKDQIKLALYNVLGDSAEVERLFPIIEAQGEY